MATRQPATSASLATVPMNTVPCQRCGKPVPPKEGFPDLCDDCYVVLGSCCNEWEPREDDPANAEPTESDA